MTARLCRSGIIAALYVALTLIFGQLAYGPLQIRPSEALCVLPLLFPEAVAGLFVGCLIANTFSTFAVLDIIIGSAVTLVSALLTRFTGVIIKNKHVRAVVGGLFPVALNAIFIPIVIILATPGGGFGAYWLYFAQILLTQVVFVYGLGMPVYYGMLRLKDKRPDFFS